MSLRDADPSPVAPLLGLVDDMRVQLDADRRRLALLVDDARDVLALDRNGAPPAALLREEILARLDRHGHDLEARQRSALSVMNEALSSSRAADARMVAENPDLWEPPWCPPAGAGAGDDAVPTCLPVSHPDQTRPQLVRVLTIVGALLIACGLLIAIL
jgi:hypothetical protein